MSGYSGWMPASHSSSYRGPSFENQDPTRHPSSPVHSRINSGLFERRSMLYPPSTVRTQPPIRPPGFTKRSTDWSLYREQPLNRSSSSISDMRLEDDIRRFNSSHCQSEELQEDSPSHVIDYQQFDQLHFSPANGQKPPDDLPTFLRSESVCKSKTPIKSLLSNDMSKSGLDVGHLSFSDITDSPSQSFSESTVYVSTSSRLSSAMATPTRVHSYSEEEKRILDFYSQSPCHSCVSSATPSPSRINQSPTRSLQREIYDKADEFKQQGNTLYEKKDYEGALEKYTLAMGYVPSDPILFSNRAACLLSMGKPHRALKDALRVIQLNPSFPRGYMRCGKCYVLIGELTKAREMYAQGMEICQRQPKERERFDECLKQVNEIKDMENRLSTLPSVPSSIQEAQTIIRTLLSIKDRCTNWRDLYLRLIGSYLDIHDLNSASIVLSRVMPNLLPTLTQSSSSDKYPFAIAAWDAEKLDLFNNDVSAVDVQLIALWQRLFVKQCLPQRAVSLWELCLKEPRFRDWRTADKLVKPFEFLSSWIHEHKSAIGCFKQHDYDACLLHNSRCIDLCTQFVSQYGDPTVEITTIHQHRFSSCPENTVCDNIIADCYLLGARCFFRCERYNEVIVECDKALNLNGTLYEVIKKRGEAYCLLRLYEKGLADFRAYLEYQPNDRKIVEAYSYYYKKAEKSHEKEQSSHRQSPFNSYFSSQSPSWSASSSEYRGMSRSYSEAKSEQHESPFKSKRTKDASFPQTRQSTVSSRLTPDNYYTLLEVSVTASEKEIRKSFLRLALLYHPDKNPDRKSQERFLKIKEAYETLIDPVKRRKYDVSF